MGTAQNGAVVAPDGRTFWVRPADAAALSPATPASAAPAPVAAVFRPASVVVHTEQPHHASPRNVWSARVRSIEPGTGGVRLRTSGDPEVIAELTPAAVADLGLQVGSTVWLSVKATDVSAYRR